MASLRAVAVPLALLCLAACGSVRAGGSAPPSPDPSRVAAPSPTARSECPVSRGGVCLSPGSYTPLGPPPWCVTPIQDLSPNPYNLPPRYVPVRCPKGATPTHY
jgi:hypothetical protein